MLITRRYSPRVYLYMNTETRQIEIFEEKKKREGYAYVQSAPGPKKIVHYSIPDEILEQYVIESDERPV